MAQKMYDAFCFTSLVFCQSRHVRLPYATAEAWFAMPTFEHEHDEIKMFWCLGCLCYVASRSPSGMIHIF